MRDYSQRDKRDKLVAEIGRRRSHGAQGAKRKVQPTAENATMHWRSKGRADWSPTINVAGGEGTGRADEPSPAGVPPVPTQMDSMGAGAASTANRRGRKVHLASQNRVGEAGDLCQLPDANVKSRCWQTAQASVKSRWRRRLSRADGAGARREQMAGASART